MDYAVSQQQTDLQADYDGLTKYHPFQSNFGPDKGDMCVSEVD